jgi:ribonuclease VapC
MIVDSSALVAIMRNEPGWEVLAIAMDESRVRLLPTPLLLETSLVLGGTHRDQMRLELDRFLSVSEVITIDFTSDHAAIARDAFLRYGKGRHPARLNFGDCIAYAVSKAERLPLLFKGGDFRLTDVEPAL